MASLGGRRLSCEADDGGSSSAKDGGADEGGGIMPRLRKVSEEAAAVVVVSIDGALVSLPSVKGIRVYDSPAPTLGFRKLIT